MNEPTRNDLEEPILEEDSVFQDDDDLSAELVEQSEKRRRLVKKTVSVLLVLALFLNVISVWPHVIRWEAIGFLRTSYRLYQDAAVKERKQAVVSVVGQEGRGTGFVIDSSGVVLTNYHVVEGEKGIYLHLPNGDSFVPTIRQSFPELDLAVLGVNVSNLVSLAADYDYEWSEGERVTFIGNPLGYLWIANEGEVLGTTKVKGIKQPVMAIRAPVYRGNSGSPVFNQQGKVIGVLFATTSLDGEIAGLAIPIRYVKGEWGQASSANKEMEKWKK